MSTETKATHTPFDWRKEYVICEHVATDEKSGTRHRGFRVCCDACWDAGFLTVEDVHAEERPDGLAVGRITKAEGRS